MLSIISPAKTLDFETPPSTDQYTQPDYLEQSRELINILRGYSPQQLAELMGISNKLAGLNTARYTKWSTPFDLDNAKQAIQAFQGDVYTGLEASTFSAEDNAFAQVHLRILSGLYGLLRPLDLIQPYRLEMGTRLPSAAGKDLYAFWRDRLTRDLETAIAQSGSNILVNLAPNEYSKAIEIKRLSARVVTPVFKDAKKGQYKIISFYAKKARGLMSAWLIRNRIDSPDAIESFDIDGYRFNSAMSEGDTLVFTRQEV